MTALHRSRLLDAALAPPVPGSYLEIDGGILWTRLPIPGPLGHINVWLVPSRRGWFLVDTGMNVEAARAAWDEIGRRLPLRTDLEAIVVTHHHPDHYGLAQWLCQRYEVPVHMTAPASAAATFLEPERTAGMVAGFVERLGLELDADARAHLSDESYRALVSGHADRLVLGPEDVIEGADQWRVSVHHGHAPGHACLYAADAGVLISGDQVLPTISSNISLYPSNEQADPLGQYLASLDALSALPPETLVLPAHGRPFATLHRRLAVLRAEHDDRLRQAAEACAEPASTASVVRRLFALDRLDALNRLLATTETLAHLRRLEVTGQLERHGRGGELRWSSRVAG